jgi:hypothetical protein
MPTTTLSTSFVERSHLSTNTTLPSRHDKMAGRNKTTTTTTTTPSDEVLPDDNLVVWSSQHQQSAGCSN